MTGMDERLARLAEVMHAASRHQHEGPARTCGSCNLNAQALAPLLAEWQAEDQAIREETT